MPGRIAHRGPAPPAADRAGIRAPLLGVISKIFAISRIEAGVHASRAEAHTLRALGRNPAGL